MVKETTAQLADRVCAEAKAATRVNYRNQVARINVTPHKDTLELRLHWWSLKDTALMVEPEVNELIRQLQEMRDQVWPKKAAKTPIPEDDFSDIA